MLQITARPYNYNFSGNAIVYGLYDADAVADSNKTFEVRLFFKAQADSSYTTVATLPLVPFNGAASIDISSLLDGYLIHEPPTLENATEVQASYNCSGLFYIHYRTITSGSATQPPFISAEEDYIKRVYKGGLSQLASAGNAAQPFFIDNALQRWATWMPQQRLLPLNAVHFLGWYNTRFVGLSGTNITAEVLVTYTDSTTATTSFDVQVPGAIPLLPAQSLIYIPAGAAQLNLPALDTAKTIYTWAIRLVQVGNAVTDWFSFENDLRSDYNNIPLLLRNSLGAVDTAMLRGIVEEQPTFETTTLQRSAAPGWNHNSLLPFLSTTYSLGEQLVYRADMGYLCYEEQEALRDALYRREVYWINNSRYWPLNILTKNITLRNNADFVYSLPIEFSVALPLENYFTPANALPAAVASSNVCGTTLAITGQSENVLSPSLSEWTINYSHSGDAPVLQYRIVTLTSSWSSTPMASQLVVNVPRPGIYQVQLRAQCADGSTGPVITRAFEVSDGTAPPANNSQVINNLSSGISFILYNGATAITSGDLEPGQTKGFYLADGVYSLTITVTGLSSYGTLVSSGGNIYALDNCTFTGGGIVEINPMAAGGTN